MHIKQSKSIYIFIGGLMGAPLLLVGFSFLGNSWAEILETGVHQILYIYIPLMVFTLLLLSKSVEFKPNQIILHQMKVFKKVINIEDLRFARLGSRCVRAIPTFIFVLHSKNDKEMDDDQLGKRTMFVDLNFNKEDREKIYKYFEDKNLLKDRKRYKYK